MVLKVCFLIIYFLISVTTLIERDCYITNAEGLDIPEVIKFYNTMRTLKNFPGAKTVEADPQSGLELPCDILIPAAMEQQVHAGNAGRIHAKIIGEAANGPVYFIFIKIMSSLEPLLLNLFWKRMEY